MSRILAGCGCNWVKYDAPSPHVTQFFQSSKIACAFFKASISFCLAATRSSYVPVFQDCLRLFQGLDLFLSCSHSLFICSSLPRLPAPFSRPRSLSVLQPLALHMFQSSKIA